MFPDMATATVTGPHAPLSTRLPMPSGALPSPLPPPPPVPERDPWAEWATRAVQSTHAAASDAHVLLADIRDAIGYEGSEITKQEPRGVMGKLAEILAAEKARTAIEAKDKERSAMLRIVLTTAATVVGLIGGLFVLADRLGWLHR